MPSYYGEAYSEHRAWTHSLTIPSLYSLLLTCIWCCMYELRVLLCDDYCRRRCRRINGTDKLKYSILWLQFKCHYAMGDGMVPTFSTCIGWYLSTTQPTGTLHIRVKYDSFYGRTIFCNFNVMAMWCATIGLYALIQCIVHDPPQWCMIGIMVLFPYCFARWLEILRSANDFIYYL